jgi:hypothetical protein
MRRTIPSSLLILVFAGSGCFDTDLPARKEPAPEETGGTSSSEPPPEAEGGTSATGGTTGGRNAPERGGTSTGGRSSVPASSGAGGQGGDPGTETGAGTGGVHEEPTTGGSFSSTGGSSTSTGGTNTTPSACTEGGDDIDSAFELGSLDELVTCKGYAETGGDFYRFELAENATFTFSVGADKIVRADLYLDATQVNLSAAHDTLSGSMPPALKMVTLEKGIYYLRVTATNTLFDMALDAKLHDRPEPAEDPSEDIDEAMDIGVLPETPLVFGGYVGRTDSEDFFVFDLPSNGTVTFTLEDVTSNVVASFYEKTGSLIDLQAPSFGPYTTTTANAPLTIDNQMPKGTHYLRIVRGHPSYDSLYTLKLSFQEPT